MAQISSLPANVWYAQRRTRQRRLDDGFPTALLIGLFAAFAARLTGFEAALLIVGSVLAMSGFALGFVAWLTGTRSDLAGGIVFLGFACALLST